MKTIIVALVIWSSGQSEFYQMGSMDDCERLVSSVTEYTSWADCETQVSIFSDGMAEPLTADMPIEPETLPEPKRIAMPPKPVAKPIRRQEAYSGIQRDR